MREVRAELGFRGSEADFHDRLRTEPRWAPGSRCGPSTRRCWAAAGCRSTR
jgi:hypothetical protein